MSKAKTKAVLEMEIKSLKSQLHCSLYAAHRELEKVSTKRMMASGVIVTITSLNGKELVQPFMCADGLEVETIEALQRQIKTTVVLGEIGKSW